VRYAPIHHHITPPRDYITNCLSRRRQILSGASLFQPTRLTSFPEPFLQRDLKASGFENTTINSSYIYPAIPYLDNLFS
jgi:hypothetical protein